MRRKLACLGCRLIVAGSAVLLAGCTDFVLNQTVERTGDITVVFINDTPYRAAFSYGTWDSLDRNPPGPMQVRQLRLAPYGTSAAATLTCARNFAVGTQEFYDRAVEQDVSQTLANFDADAFDTVVHFSDQPVDSDLAAVATVGTAAGIERLLGPDFYCADELLLTFVEDPDVAGGFRIDFAVVKDEP